jgi:hypothetical protein
MHGVALDEESLDGTSDGMVLCLRIVHIHGQNWYRVLERTVTPAHM